MRVCTPILLNCDYCFTLEKTYSDTINIAAGQTPAAVYYLWITDKFGNQYKDSITINANGSFDITLTNYPDGMMNPDNGWFDLFVSSDVNGAVIVPMIFGSSFNCLKLSTTCNEGIGAMIIQSTFIIA